MQRKFRLNNDTWNAFINKTDSPSDTLRELVNDFIDNEPLNAVIGVEEASLLWGLSPGYIKNLCAEGKIVCKKIGKTWVIDKTQPNPSKSSL
jgi:hypothetical protein